MTNTRAAAAATSLRAKQALVKLLFGPQYSRKGPQAHQLLDHSIYSHQDLRKAYLERIHELHPDKWNSQTETTTRRTTAQHSEEKGVCLEEAPTAGAGTDKNGKVDTARFVELQDAWNKYEEFAKMSKRVGKRNTSNNAVDVDPNFTLFGVGCSFSDNAEEREMRARIMDQAGRGWFSAGELGAGVEKHDNDDPSRSGNKKSSTLLTDDDDSFEHFDAVTDRTARSGESDNPSRGGLAAPASSIIRPPSLIPGLNQTRR